MSIKESSDNKPLCAFDDDDDDVRIQEIQSLIAIFPHTVRTGTYAGHIEVPIPREVETPIHVKDNHTGSRGADPKANVNAQKGTKLNRKSLGLDKDFQAHESAFSRNTTISHLPPVEFHFALPESYPYEAAPNVHIKSSILTSDDLAKIEADLQKLWMSYKDQVLFSMIDLIQEKALDLAPKTIDCGLDLVKYDSLVSHNASKIILLFNEKTFACQICQEDYKGANCTQFPTCCHVFCNNCLYDFFSNLIISGEVSKIHCPDFECTKTHIKKREQYLSIESLDVSTFNFADFRRDIMTTPIAIDFLQRILETYNETKRMNHKQVVVSLKMKTSQDLLDRYNRLFLKQQYEVISKLFPTRLELCPREGCEENIFRENLHDPLVICRKCDLAFCVSCRKSWHGTLNLCSDKISPNSDIPDEVLEEYLSLEDGDEKLRLGFKYGRKHIKKKADEYLMDKLFSEMINNRDEGLQKCPTCEIVTQRKDGCNKMICPSCSTYFCNLCGICLIRTSPYKHFQDPQSACYGRLFEGMEGMDEEDLHPALVVPMLVGLEDDDFNDGNLAF